MENKHYYHLCADGDDAKNFICSEDDFRAATNLVGVCAANTDVIVVCFSAEDSHPHFLLYCTYSNCLKFKAMYESSYNGYIVKSRGSIDDVVLDFEIIEISDAQYLMSVGTYIVVQATKDGKDVMPYDYPWGSGCLYFRRLPYFPPWMFDKGGNYVQPIKIGNLPVNQRRAILHSKKTVPDDWLLCNGILLPSNYIDIQRFESIFQTCNCYRAFLSSGKKSDEPIKKKIAEARGVSLEDIEARRLCKLTCVEMFGFQDVRRLSASQRVSLALSLRRKYCISFRQLATIVRLPESEVRKYVR